MKGIGEIIEEKELAVCDECGSLFFRDYSQIMRLCPECAHILYGYPNCYHHFQNGQCANCYWDGYKNDYIKHLEKDWKRKLPVKGVSDNDDD